MEWKREVYQWLAQSDEALETFLVEWKPGDQPASAGDWADLETFLVEWKRA